MTIHQREEQLRRRVEEARIKLQQAGNLSEVRSGQRAREIYESNAIEGLGPDLPSTYEILHSQEAAAAEDALSQGMLATSITSERKVIDVLGLNNAKILATNMVSGLKAGRMITQADIRDIHRQITDGHSYAGRYKQLPNEIQGSPHITTLPVNTPLAMADLVSWMGDCRFMPSTLFAAALHAWLVHIHPFDDGNGRVARTLVNMVMIRDGLPPVIVDHDTDRGRYIDALSLSDQGGEILPLTEIFNEVQKRFASQINRPSYIRNLVRERIAANTASDYKGWQMSFERFFTQMRSELAQYAIDLKTVGSLTPTMFKNLMDGSNSDDTWFAIARHREGYELLLALVPGSAMIYGQIESKTRYPSIIFRTRHYRADDIFSFKFNNTRFRRLSEVTIIPGGEPKVYAKYGPSDNNRLRRGRIDDAADEIAHVIAGEFNRMIGEARTRR
ncbi:Fic family protein [Nocardia rhamnosiphila]|uniref:Fic family protein n=1 Tax=Nocardia rhamnosiphila TaxID=426716 RepID=UPI0037A2D104